MKFISSFIHGALRPLAIIGKDVLQHVNLFHINPLGVVHSFACQAILDAHAKFSNSGLADYIQLTFLSDSSNKQRMIADADVTAPAEAVNQDQDGLVMSDYYDELMKIDGVVLMVCFAPEESDVVVHGPSPLGCYMVLRPIEKATGGIALENEVVLNNPAVTGSDDNGYEYIGDIMVSDDDDDEFEYIGDIMVPDDDDYEYIGVVDATTTKIIPVDCLALVPAAESTFSSTFSSVVPVIDYAAIDHTTATTFASVVSRAVEPMAKRLISSTSSLVANDQTASASIAMLDVVGSISTTSETIKLTAAQSLRSIASSVGDGGLLRLAMVPLVDNIMKCLCGASSVSRPLTADQDLVATSSSHIVTTESTTADTRAQSSTTRLVCLIITLKSIALLLRSFTLPLLCNLVCIVETMVMSPMDCFLPFTQALMTGASFMNVKTAAMDNPIVMSLASDNTDTIIRDDVQSESLSSILMGTLSIIRKSSLVRTLMTAMYFACCWVMCPLLKLWQQQLNIGLDLLEFIGTPAFMIHRFAWISQLINDLLFLSEQSRTTNLETASIDITLSTCISVQPRNDLITLLIGLLHSVSRLLTTLSFIDIITMFTIGHSCIHALIAGVFSRRHVNAAPKISISIALPDDNGCLFSSPATTGLNINDEATAQTPRVDNSRPSLYQMCTETFLILTLVPLVVILAFILMMVIVSRPDPVGSTFQMLAVCYSVLCAVRSCSTAVACLLPKLMSTIRASTLSLATFLKQRWSHACSDLYESFFTILLHMILIPLIGVPSAMIVLIGANGCYSGLVLSTLLIVTCISTNLKGCTYFITCQIVNWFACQFVYDILRFANTLLCLLQCSISIGLVILRLAGSPGHVVMDGPCCISRGVDMVELTLFYQIRQRRSQVLHIPLWEMLHLLLAFVRSLMTVILRTLKSLMLTFQCLHAHGLSILHLILMTPVVSIATVLMMVLISISYHYKGRKSSAAIADLVVATSSSTVVVYLMMKLISVSSYLIQAFITTAIRVKDVVVACINVVRLAVRFGCCILEYLSAFESALMTAVRIIITTNLRASLHIARFTLQALYTIITMCIEGILLCIATAMCMRSSKFAVPINSKVEQPPPTLVAMSDDDELSDVSDDDSVITFDSDCAYHTDVTPLPFVSKTCRRKKPHPPAELFDWHRRRGGRLRPKKSSTF